IYFNLVTIKVQQKAEKVNYYSIKKQATTVTEESLAMFFIFVIYIFSQRKYFWPSVFNCVSFFVATDTIIFIVSLCVFLMESTPVSVFLGETTEAAIVAIFVI
ncbi:hypothetical protein AMECASPLE_039779, partial [Ameca splendens]